jgi:integrase
MPEAAATLLQHHLNSPPANAGRDSLVFPGRDGKPLAPTSVYGRKARIEHRSNSGSTSGTLGAGRAVQKRAYGFYAARDAIGRPDLHWHDLRRTAATIGAQSGATVREMQHRLGHTTPTMALHYQAATTERDRTIATNIQDQINTLTTPAPRRLNRTHLAHPARPERGCDTNFDALVNRPRHLALCRSVRTHAGRV